MHIQSIFPSTSREQLQEALNNIINIKLFDELLSKGNVDESNSAKGDRTGALCIYGDLSRRRCRKKVQVKY